MMTRILLLTCVAVIAGCVSGANRSIDSAEPPDSLLTRVGRFDPRSGFTGYEAYRIYRGDAEESNADLKRTLLGVKTGKVVSTIPRATPDFIVEAFCLGQESQGDWFGFWIQDGIFAPISSESTSQPSTKLDGFAIERESLERIRKTINTTEQGGGGQSRRGLVLFSLAPLGHLVYQ